jgi:hypothetical protein
VSGDLYLGVLRFAGDREELLSGYGRLLERFPVESLDLHLSAIADGCLTVFDACPTKSIFDEFTSSATFLAAVAEAGLPKPAVEGIGAVHVVHVRGEVRP